MTFEEYEERRAAIINQINPKRGISLPLYGQLIDLDASALLQCEHVLSNPSTRSDRRLAVKFLAVAESHHPRDRRPRSIGPLIQRCKDLLLLPPQKELS